MPYGVLNGHDGFFGVFMISFTVISFPGTGARVQKHHNFRTVRAISLSGDHHPRCTSVLREHQKL
ncbi:hypothetical protein AZ039_004650 [Enterobacter kobei]|nr:hypothetical protein AZ039_004650 [Enterobacter kobei]